MNGIMQSEHEQFIRQMRPAAQHLESLGEGDFNEVISVEDEVFRFPKTQEGRNMLRFDAAILEKLSGKMSLQIPEVREIAGDGSYGIFTYVPGQVRSSKEIMTFTAEQKQLLAKTVANCMREINSALSTHEVATITKQYLPGRETEAEYYESIPKRYAQTPHHDLYVSYYDKYQMQQHKTGEPDEIVIYGDYHYGNMLFNEANELVGLIDFADLGIGTPVHDLRQLYRLGEGIVQAVIDELHGDLGNINLEQVRLLAILHEISVLMRPESQPPNDNPRADLSRQLLGQWLGERWEQEYQRRLS